MDMNEFYSTSNSQHMDSVRSVHTTDHFYELGTPRWHLGASRPVLPPFPPLPTLPALPKTISEAVFFAVELRFSVCFYLFILLFVIIYLSI